MKRVAGVPIVALGLLLAIIAWGGSVSGHASIPFQQLRTLAPNAPIVAGFPDKFNYPTGTLTPLLGILTGHNPPIQTVVITGTCACGAVLYTTFEANNAGFTTVVAEDTVSADNPFENVYIKFQLLNVPVFGNPTNIPLLLDATTLSRGDLITFH